MSAVPNDPNMSPEVRRFLDDLSKVKANLTTLIDAITTFPGFASQAEAEAGVATDKALNALRTAQAIAYHKDDLLHVQYHTADGVDGSALNTGAWRTNPLTDVMINEITGASLASNQITLPAGTYTAIISTPAANTGRHQSRFYNITDTAAVFYGSSEQSQVIATIATQTRSECNGKFTIASAKVFELQQRCNVNGLFGLACSYGVGEVYADVMIFKEN